MRQHCDACSRWRGSRRQHYPAPHRSQRWREATGHGDVSGWGDNEAVGAIVDWAMYRHHLRDIEDGEVA